jgi:HK97 family phage major capsid protein
VAGIFPAIFFGLKEISMSNRLKALREKRADIIKAAEQITEKAEKESRLVLNDDERKAHDAHLGEIKTLDGEIDREESILVAKAAKAQPIGALESVPAFSAARSVVSAHALKNIRGEQALSRAHKVGQFFLATMYGSEKAANWCRDNGLAVQKAMSEGVNSAGGFLVPEEVSMEIITLRDNYGLARQELRAYPMGRDRITIPKWVSGLTTYFVDDKGTAVTTSDPVFGQIGLTAKALAALTYVSRDLDEDAAVSMGDLIASELAWAFAKTEDGCLFSGDGTSTYGGMTGLRSIFNAGVGSLAGAVDAASGHDTMAEIDATDLASVQGKLPQYVYDRGNPKWYCSQTMFANVFERLIGASGGVTKDQASGRTIRQYNGYDVVITPAMLAPASATTDASDVAMILFGDLSMAVAMGDRRGLEVERDMSYRFANRQVAILGTERFDIVAHGTGDTSNAGAVVALMGE